MVEMTDDLRRNSVTYWVADPSVQEDWANPTVANFTAALQDGRMLDITCALDEDGTEHTLGNPELDDMRTFCTGSGKDVGVRETPELTLSIVRDQDRTANGVFNQTLAWFLFPDVPFYLIQRVGDQDTGPDLDAGRSAKPIDSTDDLRITNWTTDNPIDNLGADQAAKIDVTPNHRGFVKWNESAV